MNRIAKKDLWLFASQAAVWILMLLLLPLATFLSTRNWESTSTSLSLVWQLLRAPLVVYFANFYLFGPYLFFRRRYWLFVLCNLLLILGANYGFVYGYFAIKHNVPSMPAKAWMGFFSGAFMFFLLNIVTVAVAIGIRHFIRVRQLKQQLKDEKAKNTEAELAWLKNQIIQSHADRCRCCTGCHRTAERPFTLCDV